MKLLEFIDGVLLNYASKIARFVYRWTGIGNFKLAKIIFVPSFAVTETFISLRPGPIFDKVVYHIVMFLFNAILYLVIEAVHRKHKIGFLNIARKSFVIFVFRIQTFIFSLGSLFFIFLRGTASDKFFCLYFSCTCLAFCLASIESEPPSESKLKKFITSLRGMFSSDPVPQGC